MAGHRRGRIKYRPPEVGIMKSRVLEAIGLTELRSASDVGDALTANDRVKYLFSLLQMATSHADHPEQAASSLKRERRACGIDDASLDDMVETAQFRDGQYQLPGAATAMRL